MKNHMFALCLSLFAVSCDSKSSVSPKSSDASKKASMKKGASRDLGWVKYEGGGWMETSSPYIAVLGAARLQDDDDDNDKCDKGTLAFKRTRVVELNSADSTLDPAHLGELESQYVAGTASGIIVRERNRSFLVTASHADGYIGQSGIINYSLKNTKFRGGRDVLCVPRENVVEFGALAKVGKVDKVDVLACELSGRSDGLHLTSDNVKPGTEIHTRIHPFGLPMKSSVVKVSSCHGNQCWAPFDNAESGSGGGVLTANGELAGMVIGDAQSTLDGYWKPCECYPQGGCYNRGGEGPKCSDGQPFVTSAAIRVAISGAHGKMCASTP